MSSDKLIPYAMAQRRFSHACRELVDQTKPVNERLLDAIVALSPLRDEDMPRACQLLYEKIKNRIGPGLWSGDVMAGALATSIRSLPPTRVTDVFQWIVMASEALDKHCSKESGEQTDTINDPVGIAANLLI